MVGLLENDSSLVILIKITEAEHLALQDDRQIPLE